MKNPATLMLPALLLCTAPLLAAPATAPGNTWYTGEKIYESRPDPARDVPFGWIGTTGIMARVYPGVTVKVERPINDSFYDWLDGSPRGFHLDAGTHRLDARTALAYVRSRYGDSDFARAARQQQLLLALRNELLKPSNIGSLPALLGVAGETIRTNFPPDRMDEMVQLAQDVVSEDVERVVLQPPTYSVHPPNSETGGTYILRIRWNAIRALSVRLFGEDSDFWTGEVDASGSPIPLAAP